VRGGGREEEEKREESHRGYVLYAQEDILLLFDQL
jgi:hypothetical protein